MALGTATHVRCRSIDELGSFLPISSSVILPPIGVGKLTMSLEAKSRVYVNKWCAPHKSNQIGNKRGGRSEVFIKVRPDFESTQK